MAKAELPYTFVIVKPSGLKLWYFRHRAVPGPPKRILGQPGEAAFHAEYKRLLHKADGTVKAERQRRDTGSFRWLAEQYEASKDWQQLKPKTRTGYKRELERLKDMAGDLPFRELDALAVRDMRDAVIDAVVASQHQAVADREAADAAATVEHEKRVAMALSKGRTAPEMRASRRKPPAPVDDQTGVRTGDLFKSVLGALMSYAARRQMVAVNPVKGVEKMQRKSHVAGHDPWHEHQIATVLAKAPRWIADGVILGVCTGQRLEDVVAMTKGQVLGDDVRVRQLKTNTLVEVPIAGPLKGLVVRRIGANDPDDSALLLVQRNGRPYSERLFSDHLRAFLDSLGWTDISFHGLRYSAAGRLNEAGCSVAVISSIVGHSTYEMAMKYATKRQNASIAGRAMDDASRED